jgi:hypothetical protein
MKLLCEGTEMIWLEGDSGYGKLRNLFDTYESE